MNDIQILIDELVKFRDARNWNQFHNTKDLALAISIEAAELNELFLWKTTEESELVDRNKLKEELADVFAFSLLLAGKHGFDVKEIVLEKIKKNGEKYPSDTRKSGHNSCIGTGISLKLGIPF
jgi:NTP pyrophosphatase (non-canonical NTP hydrolase)